MNGIIESDFEVNAIAQNDDMDFFGASKNVFYHFVFLLKKDGYNEIKQYYIPRFQIANWLYNYWEKDGAFILDLPDSGISLILEYQIDLDALKISDDFNIVIVYNDNTIYFPLKGNSFGEILLKDYELLTKVYADSVKNTFRKKVISKIIGAFDETITYPFSLHSLIIAAFELKLLKTKNKWRQTSGVYRILRTEFNVSLETDPYLVSNLITNLH